MCKLALGIDCGTSGLRLAVNDPSGDFLLEDSQAYPGPFEDPESWRQGLLSLIHRLPSELSQRIGAVALAGTSGTLLMCEASGELLAGPLGRALPYHQACISQLPEVCRLLAEDSSHPAGQASGSLARALHLLQESRHLWRSQPLLIRHQADWLMGWLLGNWRWGEEGTNLRLGWDVLRQRWLGSIAEAPWVLVLPDIVPSGTVLGTLAPAVALALGLPDTCQVVAGTTDANAAVLAAEPEANDGITVLGSSLVLKQFVPEPIQGVGVSCHRVNGSWLLGGASNTGTAILSQFFTASMVTELSRQITPELSTGLKLRPLLGRGERFPVDDPHLEPVLDPRPVSDARFFQALLEGITAIELDGWQRLRELGAPPIQRIITLGGGATNAHWRLLRQRILGLPVLNRPHPSAARGMALLAQGKMGISRLDPAP